GQEDLTRLGGTGETGGLVDDVAGRHRARPLFGHVRLSGGDRRAHREALFGERPLKGNRSTCRTKRVVLVRRRHPEPPDPVRSTLLDRAAKGLDDAARKRGEPVVCSPKRLWIPRAAGV